MYEKYNYIYFFAAIIFFLSIPFAKADDNLLSGTGIILGVENKEPVVIGVFPDSPAGKAGIKPGDKVVEFNIFRFFEKADVQNSSNLQRALTDKPGRKIGLRLKRGSQNIELSLPTAEFPVNRGNIPRSGFKGGKITGVKNRQGTTSFTAGDGIEWGDKFLAFKGAEYLGQASVTEINPDSSRIKFIGNLNNIDVEKFNNADLYLMETSPRHFNKYPKPPRISDHPTYKKYWKETGKDKYSILTSAQITKINKTTGIISIISHRAASAGP